MGKLKKGFNWKAREIVEVKTDDSYSKKISVEIDSTESYDESNPLVLPSKKRQSVTKRTETNPVKILSKKQRKQFEKVVEKKKKRKGRAELLKLLLQVQGTPELLGKLTSISEAQTKGIKRIYQECDENIDEVKLSDSKKLKLHSIKGRRKIKQKSKISNPSIVGFSSSESEEDDYDIKEKNDIEQSVLEAPIECDSTIDDVEIIGVPDESKNIEVIDMDGESVTETYSKSSNNATGAQNKKNTPNKPATVEKSTVSKTVVFVDRLKKIRDIRKKLPIIGKEQEIMEAIYKNDVVIVAGETGSGKTTQIPQFLYEAGYTLNGRLIGVTEPRRVAAISMSRRVAEELNLGSDIVSYLIRFEGNSGPKTQIKFMTDGVLLKEIRNDSELSKYSVIILDEAHERSIYTDILIGLLSIITRRRREKGNPLKLIIMSATLRLSEFTKLFENPDVIKVNARQHSVTIHFNKRTATDYIKEAYRKAFKIHTQLPEGGILIFLTGQQEVNILVKKLRRMFPYRFDKKKSAIESEPSKTNETLTEESESDFNDSDEMNIEETKSNKNVYEVEDSDDEIDSKTVKRKLKKVNKNSLPEINLENYATTPNENEMEGDELDNDFVPEEHLFDGKFQPMWVLPLYSFLDSKKQSKVFEPPPEGCRLCVVATNVAETSLTIPSIKYVIDSGRTKVRLYDKVTGVTTFKVQWTSKASADQRAGRAGRNSAGHCYRLYSSAVFNHEFEDWTVPEIQRKPIDDIVLQLKSMGINEVITFPFISPPDMTQLKVAEKRLTLLGAIEESLYPEDEWKGKLTPLGESMAAFPVSPRFAKMLCLSNQFNLLPYTVMIVAALSVQQFLLQTKENFIKIWKTWAGEGEKLLFGDIMVLLTALGSAEYANTKGKLEQFCNDHGLRYKAVIEARKLRVQLTNELNTHVPDLNLSVDPNLKPPTDDQARKLRQIILSGMADQVARKLSPADLKKSGLSAQKAAYRIPDIDDIIFLNSASVLRKTIPDLIVYQEVYQVNDKLYARGVTAIQPEWLPLYATPFCNIFKEYPPYYKTSTERLMCKIDFSFGRSGWKFNEEEIEYRGEDRYKWFAQFFLRGDVCSVLNEYVPCLLSSPDSLFYDWVELINGDFKRRITNLLDALEQKNVFSKSSLLECWKLDERYLLEQYLEWLPNSKHAEVEQLWPPE